VASGAFEGADALGKDSITAELEQMASQQDVNAQLAAMKAELGSAEKPAIEGN